MTPGLNTSKQIKFLQNTIQEICQSTRLLDNDVLGGRVTLSHIGYHGDHLYTHFIIMLLDLHNRYLDVIVY